MNPDAKAVAPRELLVHSRPGCHLCAEALELLQPLADELGLTLREVDIEADERLHRRYLEAIPVVCIAGVELARLDEFRAAGFAQRLRTFVRHSY